jgi:hypothetical protein
MEDVLWMERIDAQTNLDEELPSHIFANVFLKFGQISAQISMPTVFHHDIYRVPLDERIVVRYLFLIYKLTT